MKNSRPLPLGSRSQSYGSRPVDLDAKTSFPKGANPNNNRATVVTRGFDTDRRTPSGTYRTFNLLLCRSLCRRLARARPPSPARSTRQHRNSHARGHVAGTSALPAPAGCVQVFPLRSCARAGGGGSGLRSALGWGCGGAPRRSATSSTRCPRPCRGTNRTGQRLNVNRVCTVLVSVGVRPKVPHSPAFTRRAEDREEDSDFATTRGSILMYTESTGASNDHW